MLSLALALVVAAQPTVGGEAPDFEVVDVDGTSLHLNALVEKGPVVIAFFPMAFTPG